MLSLVCSVGVIVLVGLPPRRELVVHMAAAAFVFGVHLFCVVFHRMPAVGLRV